MLGDESVLKGVQEVRRIKTWWIALPVLVMLLFFIWTTDRVSFQGERTIYTVNCLGGNWVGDRCSGEMVPGPRVRYRALRAHSEVLFWAVGANAPLSKLTKCNIQDGRNWTCPTSDDASKSLALGMLAGQPMQNAAWSTQPFHAVSKVRWLLLYFGMVLLRKA